MVKRRGALPSTAIRGTKRAVLETGAHRLESLLGKGEGLVWLGLRKEQSRFSMLNQGQSGGRPEACKLPVPAIAPAGSGETSPVDFPRFDRALYRARLFCKWSENK